MKQPAFDVIVVGGGHAGVEAASVAARAGARTALVTLRFDAIGQMSCNPAVGGLGKGHLVREIDAMDGLMGRVSDISGIQFRLLNRRKGPAVQGPRAQIDRQLYKQAMQQNFGKNSGVRVLEGEVVDLLTNEDEVSGVLLADGSLVSSLAVVLTTGTFLRGVIRRGAEAIPAGRVGDRASVRLAERLEGMGLPLGRLKTGTPPRLDGRTIQWDRLEVQEGDGQPTMFSFLSTGPTARQVNCAITHTNTNTHEIIEDNLGKSAIYGGFFDSSGPRYCPSIEDKIVRFPEKSSHQIFLEPEGISDDTIYPNGISTSLPTDIQQKFVRTIQGLEHVEVLQPGYAIEYDYLDPRSLTSTLECRQMRRLYFAGQINGTTGYEEAAGQGLVAGLNAARKALGKDAARFSRAQSYIGVMIDDLITRGVTEPYRMFTSRAEFRLSLRCDNADQRLTPQAISLGIACDERVRAFSRKVDDLQAAETQLGDRSMFPTEAGEYGIRLSQDGVRRSGLDLLTLPDVNMEKLAQIWPELALIEPAISVQLEKEAVYSRYLDRQQREAAILQQDEACRIPDSIDYHAMQGLSGELTEKLGAIRPETLAQASRIEGITPSALALIYAAVQRGREAA